VTEKPDFELVEAAVNGDVDGFTVLCGRYYPAMVAIAHSVLGDKHLAEDAAQDALAKACRKLGQLRNKDRFAGWLAAICRNVAMDMWEAYINRVKYHCPNAKIVFDFFHLVQSFGRVIDKVRHDEYLKATKQERKVLKGSRYLLLKNEENLTEIQQSRLQAVLELNSTLSILYVLKDQLKLLYYYSDRRKVKRALDNWCRMAKQLEHSSVQAFIKRLRFFEYGILNHADYPIGTSRLEGVNNKIKVIKRKAYGFHDSEYFALKVKQAFAA